MKSILSTKFAYDHKGCHLDFTLTGDEEKKAYVEMLEQAKKDVEASIEVK